MNRKICRIGSMLVALVVMFVSLGYHEDVLAQRISMGARIYWGNKSSQLYGTLKDACEKGYSELYGDYPFKATYVGNIYNDGADYNCSLECQATDPSKWASDCATITTYPATANYISCPFPYLVPTLNATGGWDCLTTGPIHERNTGSSCPFCGNPIHPQSGNKFEREIDYSGVGPFPLVFERWYNSDALARKSSFWRTSYSQRIVENNPRVSYGVATVDTATLIRPDGRVVLQYVSAAVPTANNGNWRSFSDVTDKLERLGSPNTTWYGVGSNPNVCFNYPSHYAAAQCYAITGHCAGANYLFDVSPTEVRYQCYNAAGAPGVIFSIYAQDGFIPTGWKYTTGDGDLVEIYDNDGKLLSITNRAGLTQTLNYSDVNTPVSVAPLPDLLIGVIDPVGRQLNFTYHSTYDATTHALQSFYLNAMTDPAGGVYQFTPDASGNLASVLYPDGGVRTYVYENAAFKAALTGIIDENGQRFATWVYDAQGRAISSEHAGGVEHVTLNFNADGTSTATNALNTSVTYGYGFQNGVAQNTGIAGSPCPTCGPASQTFDANGFIASRSDWNGNLTCYKNDVRGLENVRVEGLTGTCPGDLTLSTVPAAAPARKVTTQWHATFRLPVKVAEPLRITTNVYNGDGSVTCGAAGALCSKTIQATTDATGAAGVSASLAGAPRTWNYTYNAAGQMLTVDGPRADANDVTAYTYDAQNNLATVTNALGQVTRITAYDAHGKPLTIVDPNGLTTTLAYDARQRLVSRNVGGEVTNYTYDGVGEVTSVTLPDGSYLGYTYDPAHRLTQMIDNLNNKIVYALDVMSNRTQEQVFDPANTLAQTRSRVYSNLNRLFQEIGAQGQTTQYAYDNQGNVTGITDPLNRVTANAYDALNRLKQVTDPGTGVTKYGYNGLDQRTQVTDPRNLVTGYTVDGLGNLTQQASPDTGTSTSTYDAAGNLLTRTDAKGQVTSYAYDALNRVTSITFHDGSKQTYAYDQGANGIGRLTNIAETDPANQVTNQIAYAYDQKGRVLSETRTIAGVAFVNGYSYDSAGRLSGMTYPSGRTVAYSFDALGRIAGITTSKDGDTKTVVSSVAYQPFGGVKSVTYGNGQTYARQYDQDGRIAAYTLGATQYNLGYDAASRINFIAENGNAGNTNGYGYDSLDRLTQATLPANSFGYGYDAVGNRLAKTAGANTDTYAYGATSNRVASITPASGPARNFQFDANGSTIADGANQYSYDTRGRLVQAISSAGTSQYQINALGQRVQKSAPGANGPIATVFHYDMRGQLIAESDATGAQWKEYLYLNGLPVVLLR